MADRVEDPKQKKFSFRCACGAVIGATADQLGKTFKCPSCKQPIQLIVRDKQNLPHKAIAPIAVNTPAETAVAARPSADEQRISISRSTMIGLWSAVAAVAVICTLFAVWWSHHVKQQELAQATIRLTRAAEDATTWLQDGKLEDVDRVEQALTTAAANQLVHNLVDATVFEKIRQRKTQLQELIVKAQRRSLGKSDLADAKRYLDARRIDAAESQLKQCLENPDIGEIEFSEAQLLSDEISAAKDEKAVLGRLLKMPESEMEQVTKSFQLPDERIKHPALIALRSTVIKKILPAAIKQREKEHRLAEEHRLAMAKEQQALEVAKAATEKAKLAEDNATLAAENARLAEDNARITKLQRQQMLLSPREDVTIGDLRNYPERYVGKCLAMDPELKPTDQWTRDQKLGVFKLDVLFNRFANGGQAVYSNDRTLNFVMSEQLAANIKIQYSQSPLVYFTVQRAPGDKSGLYFARIYFVQYTPGTSLEFHWRISEAKKKMEKAVLEFSKVLGKKELSDEESEPIRLQYERSIYAQAWDAEYLVLPKDAFIDLRKRMPFRDIPK